MTPITEQEYKIKIEELQKEIEILKKKQTKKMKSERYGLNWIDVPEAFEKESENKIPVLKEVKDKAIKNDDGKPTHILIEGDNYHALKCLNYTHAGKIDVIYIDPPYNTGSDGFIYKDARFLEQYPDGTTIPKEHPLRHSTWLSFMSKRLKLAKNLLSEKGVIFISIDDNEQANLKLLCDQVFGEENFVGTIIQNKLNAKNDTINIQKNHEYILVYKKRTITENTKTLPSLINVCLKQRKVFEESGEYYYLNDSITTRGEGGTLNARPNLGYSIYYNPESKDKIAIVDYDITKAKTSNSIDIYEDNKELLLKGYVPIRPPKVRNQLGCWTWDLTKFNNEKKSILVIHTRNGYSVKKRTFVKKEEVYKIDNDYFYDSVEFNNSKSILEFSTNEGTDVLNQILQKSNAFSNPKNTEMIQYFINLFPSPSSTILDFFAGSGTTLHATMKLNAEDGGNRQCILVQQKETASNICESITYERNRRVMQGYTNSKGEEIPGLGNSLKYYKTDFIGEHSEKLASDEDKILLAQKAGCLISLSENTLEEIKTTEYYQLYTDGKKLTAIYFNEDPEMFPDFVEDIAEVSMNSTTTHKTTVYVYCEGNPEIYENEFEDLTDIEIKAIPHPILQIYKTLNEAC